MEVFCCLSQNKKEKVGKIRPLNDEKVIDFNYGIPLTKPNNAIKEEDSMM